MASPATPAIQRMSLDAFLALPEDGPKYELEYGELIELTRPTFEHNELSGILFSILLAHVRANRLGRISMDIVVVLDEAADLAFAPDLVFVSAKPFQPGVFPDLKIDLKALIEGPEAQYS